MRWIVVCWLFASAAQAQDVIPDPPPTELTSPDENFGAAMLGAGGGLLAAGVGLDLLLFAVADRGFDGGNGEAGLALAIPTVLSTGGIFMMAGGIADLAGGDEQTVFLAAGVASLVTAAALLVAAIAVGFDDGGSVWSTPREDAAMLLGAHAGASLLYGVLGLIFGFVDLPEPEDHSQRSE